VCPLWLMPVPRGPASLCGCRRVVAGVDDGAVRHHLWGSFRSLESGGLVLGLDRGLLQAGRIARGHLHPPFRSCVIATIRHVRDVTVDPATNVRVLVGEVAADVLRRVDYRRHILMDGGDRGCILGTWATCPRVGAGPRLRRRIEQRRGGGIVRPWVYISHSIGRI